MSHMTKSTVQGHLDFKKHEVAVDTMKKREKARVEHRVEAKEEALPQPRCRGSNAPVLEPQ